MYSTEDMQVGPEPGTSPFTGIVVHLTPTIRFHAPYADWRDGVVGREDRDGGPFSPHVPIPFVGLKSGATHHVGERRRVQVRLHALPECMHVLARHAQFTRARRAVGSPLVMPRRKSTRVAGRCRVFANAVPVSRVS
jgi:hypothetical protein